MFVLSAMVMLGANWCWCTDTDKEAHLTTCCLDMPLCMPRSVNIDHTHINTKNVCVGGGSPQVNVVIFNTNWCWYAGTDKESHLSIY